MTLERQAPAWLQRVAVVLGGASAFLGCVVLLGWYTESPQLIQVLPTFVPMQYNTALGFLLCGVGLIGISREWTRLTIAFGTLAGTIGLLTLVEYVLGLSLGIDQLLMEHYITVETSHPGRMAPNTALCFSITGAALLIRASIKSSMRRCYTTGFLGASILMLGVVALSGYISGASTAYGWGNLTRMAIHTSAGFIMLGAGILTLARYDLYVLGPDVISDPELQRKKIRTRSIAVMAMVAVVVLLNFTREVSHRSFDEKMSSLSTLSAFWAERIHSVALLDSTQDQQDPEWSSDDAVLNLARIAQENLEGFAESGELILARLDGDQIVFLSTKAQTLDETHPRSVSLNSEWAEPMRYALMGESGAVVGLDYRGKSVLAAYEPIEGTRWGLVAKIDMHEIQAPFRTALLLALGTLFVALAMGWLALLVTVDPVIRGLVERTSALRREIAERKQIDQELLRVNRALLMVRASNQALLHITNENELFEEVCCIAVEIGGFSMAWVGIPDNDEERTIRPVASAGVDDYLRSVKVTWADDEWGRGPTGTAIRTCQTQVSHQLLTNPDYDPWREQVTKSGFSSSIALPLKINEDVIGVLNIFSDVADAFDTEEVSILEEMALDLSFGLKALQTKEAQVKAQEELRKLSRATHQSPVSIVITDIDGVIGYTNPKFTEVSGYTAEEVLGENPRLVKSGKHPDSFYRTLWKTITAGLVWSGELQNKKKDGDLFWEHATISPITDDEGNVTHFVAMKEDITERKELEEQLLQAQKMEAIGALAGGVAHDFNNLLTVIGGYSQILLAGLGDSSVMKGQIKQIKEASDRAATLTRQLLAFSRRQPLEKKIIDLTNISENLEKMLRRLIGEDIELITSYESRLPSIMADPGQIEQVLMNIVVNARDAMPEGGKLTIRTGTAPIDADMCKSRPGLSPGKHVYLSIEDNGTGMDDKTADRIFEPFYTTKELGEGTGLGLSVVYGIVKQHEGCINVESEPGRGSIFTVFFPLSSLDTQDETMEEMSLQDYAGNGERILLVEDEEDVRRFATKMLQENGYSVIEASTAEDALDVFKREQGDFQLVFSDVVLPGMGGVELVEELLSGKPELKVLLASGYPDYKSKWDDIQKKKLPYLQKPFGVTDLLMAIKQVLQA